MRNCQHWVERCTVSLWTMNRKTNTSNGCSGENCYNFSMDFAAKQNIDRLIFAPVDAISEQTDDVCGRQDSVDMVFDKHATHTLYRLRSLFSVLNRVKFPAGSREWMFPNAYMMI